MNFHFELFELLRFEILTWFPHFSEYKNNQPVEIPLFRTEEGRYLATCE